LPFSKTVAIIGFVARSTLLSALPQKEPSMSGIHGFTRANMYDIFIFGSRTPPSPKQIQYWSQNDLITYELISTKTAIYSFQTILNMFLIQDMLKAGLSLAAVRETLFILRRDQKWMTSLHKPGSFPFMADGHTVKRLDKSDSEEYIDFLVSQLDGRASWRAYIVNTDAVIKKAVEAVLSFEWSSKLSAEEQYYLKVQG
jgi:DNA-binding transcriptional MerR regulator